MIAYTPASARRTLTAYVQHNRATKPAHNGAQRLLRQVDAHAYQIGVTREWLIRRACARILAFVGVVAGSLGALWVSVAALVILMP